jgi:hypothetical protein
MVTECIKRNSTTRVQYIRLKKCARCDHPKPITEFYRVKCNPDGYDRYCKVHRIACTTRYHKRNRDKQASWSAVNRAKNKAHFQIHGAAPKKHPRKRICPKCKQPRFDVEFQINKQRSSGRESWCRYCRGPRARSRAKRFYNGNRDYVRLIRDPKRWKKIAESPFLHGIELEKERLRQVGWKLRSKGL